MTANPHVTISLLRQPGEDDLAYYARITTPSKGTARDAAPAATADYTPRLTEKEIAGMRQRAAVHLKPAGKGK